MLIIQDKLVSLDVIEKEFVCNLNACKGACCWEGDWGAPVSDEELSQLDDAYPKVKHLLSLEGQKAIEENGTYTYFDEPAENGTTLIDNGACAFLIFEEGGIAKCGIEKGYELGLTDFYKPISCHLYPIRVEEDKRVGFEALNYDKWDICSAACTNGKKLAVPVYEFVKNALVRKYGSEFYEELDEVAKDYLSQEKGKR